MFVGIRIRVHSRDKDSGFRVYLGIGVSDFGIA